MLLGWIAGTMTVTDPALVNPSVMPSIPKIEATDMVRYGAGIFGALLVLAIGKWLTARKGPAPDASGAEAGGAAAIAGGLHRILLAVDGSDGAARATQQVIAMRRDLRDPSSLELKLLNVQRPVSGDVSSFVAGKTLDEYYHDLGEQALTPMRKLLDEAGVAYDAIQRVGTPGETIAKEAREQSVDVIVMGTKGMGAAASLLGSVTQSTLEGATVPVLLVK
jgi:nucleotide-binding universal stress UspA family protein